MVSLRQICMIAVALSVSFSCYAQEAGKWGNESEASVVQVGGNTQSESYSVKQKTSYLLGLDTYTLAARYLQTTSSGAETAKSWAASAKYERSLSEMWAVFVQHGAESDNYAGYIQRDSTDLGGKYFFVKSDDRVFFSEFGARTMKVNLLNVVGEQNNISGRLYFEYGAKLTASTSAKLWLEYLPNFTDAEAWLMNYEPSMSVMMNGVFSLKLSYLAKHHEKVLTATEKKDDTTFTVSLVAKF